MSSSPIESTDEWTVSDLDELAASRSDQPSFHLFSEQHMRGQMFNLSKGDVLSETVSEASVLITCIRGEIEVNLNGTVKRLLPLSQVLISPNVRFSIRSTEVSSIQMVWSPSFGRTEPIVK